MAEIRVEHKQKSVWPWILGILLVALVIWGVAEMMDNDREVEAEADISAIELVLDEAAAARAA